MVDPPELVGSREAARLLGVDRTTLWRWRQLNKVTPEWVTPGGHARWDMRRLREQVGRIEETVMPGSADIPVEQPIVAAVITSEQGMLVTWRNDANPPAGFLTGEIEPGESPADALTRECKEEAGLQVRAGKVIGRRIHPRTGRDMVYVAGELLEDGEPFVGDEDELADVRWVSLAEADEAFAPFGGMYPPVHDYLRRTLPE